MIKSFVFNHYGVNCYLVADEAGGRCAVVDPACVSDAEFGLLAGFVERQGWRVERVMLTHAHVDHIAGLRRVCGAYGLPVTMHADGRKLLRQAASFGSMMGFDVDDMSDLEVVEIGDGQRLEVGAVGVECRLVPGHCPGSMCYVVERERAVLTGDALFHFSIGRTDLPGGDYDTLIDRLRSQVLTLPDDYAVLPGHGIASRIDKERRYNPFLRP